MSDSEYTTEQMITTLCWLNMDYSKREAIIACLKEADELEEALKDCQLEHLERDR